MLEKPDSFTDKLRDMASTIATGGDAHNVVTVVHAGELSSDVVANSTSNGSRQSAVDPQVGAASQLDASGGQASSATAVTGGGGFGEGFDFSVGRVSGATRKVLKNVGELWSELGEALSGTIFRILISLYQVLKPLGPVFEIRYPSIYLDYMELFGVIELDFLSINAMPFSCAVKLNFIHSLLLRTAGPLAVVCMMASLMRYLGRKAKEKAHDGLVTEAKKLSKLSDLTGNGLFMLIFIIYPSTSSLIFQVRQNPLCPVASSVV